MPATRWEAAPSRRFSDVEGRAWRVRKFAPAAPSHLLSMAHTEGWLTFEREDGERRRLVPAPDGWEALPDDALVDALACARPVPRADVMRQLFATHGWNAPRGV